jgi:predicted DCC family thiol-disulfide oxidoreductase YuxK
MSAPRSLPPVLLYDGECGVCAASVQFVLQREASDRHRLHFAPLQGKVAADLRARFPALASADSVVWYTPSPDGGRILLRSDAVLAVLRYLGGVWMVLGIAGHLVPRPLRDGMYRAVAQRRKSLAAPACLLPTSQQRARFLP